MAVRSGCTRFGALIKGALETLQGNVSRCWMCEGGRSTPLTSPRIHVVCGGLPTAPPEAPCQSCQGALVGIATHLGDPAPPDSDERTYRAVSGPFGFDEVASVSKAVVGTRIGGLEASARR